MNKKHFAAVCIAGASVLWACGNNDKNDGGTMTTGETTMSDTSMSAGTSSAPLDTAGQNFAMTAASSDMLEIQASNLAMQNASSERVKSFATTLIRDHGMTSDQLKGIAAGKNVTLPAELMPAHKNMLDGLQGKTGKDFDKAFADMNVKAHQEAVNLFDRASKSLTDADLKAFASEHLPHLQMHLDSAKAINGAIR